MNDSRADTAGLVLCTVDGGVATLTLNRPQVLNALITPLLAELRARLEVIAGDDTIRAVVLTGAGRGFSSGADLSAALSTPDGARPDVQRLLRESYHPVILALRRLPKPVIAAVNGPCAGAGMSLALACDVVLAARSATFLQAFSKIGLIPDAGSTWLLPRLAGESRARAMAILAETIDAERAVAMGLAWRVVADDALAAAALDLARTLAARPTRAIALIKQALDTSPTQALPDQLETEATLQAIAAGSEDFAEGVAAFLGKRQPRFVGR